MLLLKCVFLGFNDIVDPKSTIPLLRLVNKVSLDRILQSEVYVNESNSQLRAAHLILGYTPISRAFQAPRCVIRAKDPRLHYISVAYEGFVVPEGIPLPRSTPLTQPLPVATLSAGVPSPSPILQVEEEEEEEQEEEGFVDLTESTDDFEVFNQPSPPRNMPEEMGIQRNLKKFAGAVREPTKKRRSWEIFSTQASTSSTQVSSSHSSAILTLQDQTGWS